MMKKTVLFSFMLALLMPVEGGAREVSITSPNTKLTLKVSDEGPQATYAITLDGQQMLLPSALGFSADFGDFTQSLKIIDTKTSKVDRTYEMRQVKQSKMHYVAEVLTVDFENAKGQKMSVEFSVSNNDVAFRYHIPRQKNDNPKCAVIEKESTAFVLPDGTTTFITPQSSPMVGWERTKPSYEEGYSSDGAMTARSQYRQGYTFPCLFHVPSTATQSQYTGQEGWVLISETGVDSHYCGSHLSDYPYTIAYPMTGENNGNGTATAGIALPGKTPWRTITVGNSLKPIVETTIAYDVVEPLYEPSLQYGAGRYTWSWLIWQDNSINYDDQVKFIDLASAMGYEFCLVDNWWDQNIGRDRIVELSKYAQSKGVSLMLWYNSNGHENDAPQTPRNCLDNSIARDREMAWLKSIGVKGIKVDFFGGDKQETMKLYEDILFDANRYGIQCIFHGCTLPRGWERMYPNYVASEAVLASENVYFNEGAAIRQPFDLTLHPYCRNAVGTMDWGGVIMNKYLQELPQHELSLLRDIPTTWDETRFIDGYPGRYVVLARRHGDKWYVAGLNAQKGTLTLSLDLSAYGLTNQFTDQADKKGRVIDTAITPLNLKKGKVTITLQSNGGFLMW